MALQRATTGLARVRNSRQATTSSAIGWYKRYAERVDRSRVVADKSVAQGPMRAVHLFPLGAKE